MIGALFAWVAAAWAVPADVVTAADENLPQEDRMAAFQRLVDGYSGLQPELVALARDENGDSRQRWIAIRVIGQIPSDDSLDILLQLTEDPQPAMRVAAISALADTRSGTASAKIATLLDDPAMLVRGAAADALGVMKDPSTVGDLMRALDNPDNFYRGSSLWVRRHYVMALGNIGSRDAIPALIKCFDDQDEELVSASLAAMKQIVGYDFSEGRSQAEHIEAWQRWWANGGKL